MADIQKQLEKARESLLDLTMRNRLVNFKPSKSSTIRVSDEIAREVYDILVLKEKAMSFLPTKKGTADSPEVNELNEVDGLTDKEKAILWEFPSIDSKLESRHTDNHLQTNLDREALQRRLFRVYQQANSALEEQGYTILYLAAGFLEWYENENALESRKSPLILIPVELQRASVKESFKLSWTGDDISTNISLKAALSNQGIVLPEFETPEDKADVDKYIQSVVASVAAFPKWKVLNDIYLGFFSFTKFVMYKDLDLKAWPEGKSPLNNPIIQTIFGNPSGGQSNLSGITEDDMDFKIKSHDVFHVTDADPSQMLVIADAKAGSNLVVEGPPGTGKSQTITNMIAELLGNNKKVLFVSEKMAALEVVKSRLDKAGLGGFCLELHSRKSNKKEVLQELERSTAHVPPRYHAATEEYARLHSLKQELNEYASDLKSSYKSTGFSPFELYSIRERSTKHFQKINRNMPRFSNFASSSHADYVTAKQSLQNIEELLPFIGSLKKHPWRGVNIEVVLPSDEEEIQGLLKNFQGALSVLMKTLKEISKTYQIKMPSAPSELKKVLDAVKVISSSSPTDKSVLLNGEWNQPSDAARLLIGKLEEFREFLGRVSLNFKPDIFQEAVPEIVEEYKKHFQNKWRIFNSRYRNLKKRVYSFRLNKDARKTAQIVEDLEQLAICYRLKSELQASDQSGRGLFGSLWQIEKSDPEKLRLFSNWIVTFRKELISGLLMEESVEVINNQNTKTSKEIIDTLTHAIQEFESTYKQMANKLHLHEETAFNKGEFSQVEFKNVLSRIQSWSEEINKLAKWAKYIQFKNECSNTISAPILSFIEEDLIDATDITFCFDGNFSEFCLNGAFSERKSLSKFDGDLHNRKIDKFSALDRELLVKNGHRLINKLHDNRPTVSSNASSGSEAGILLSEFSKKRRHMPIRKLLFAAGELVQKIKPCFMMSPLSIAQFLDPKSIQFDVVIFDEASQVKPEDALGAFLRAKQIIVMGDTRQLPPTSFFDNMIASEEENEDLTASVSDVESILHMCKGKFPSRMLSWHYRSRHESLIAVSNQEIYENKLLIYPSSFDTAEHIGLSFVHLPEAVYDRGRSSVNRKEAKAVAEAAIAHFKKFPKKSLGVGTFNMRQQEAILEEIELQLRLNPEMEEFFSSAREEHFFVKNLETIQGDERDVIFLSVGYGFDEARKFSKNFGPLNQDGGHRRLNVLITRSREKCVVFSNFRALDLGLDENSPFGLKVLKVFLEYAETRKLQSVVTDREDSDSPFEDAVYSFLTDHGHVVRKQVGCAKFRIDMAVVDPEYPGRYLLAVECDGAKYHNSPVARDRDRLRQQILEGLGWKIHRIWSTDWYRNRKETEKALLSKIESIKKNERQKECVSNKERDDEFKANEHSSSSAEKKLNVTPKEVSFDYAICAALSISTEGELHEQNTSSLARAVCDVVEVEGPIHCEQVIRRIRALWGLKRSGGRIEEAIQDAIEFAQDRKMIRVENKFLWPIANKPLMARKRQDDAPAKIDFICDEEIGEAVKCVLSRQHATILDELIKESSRVLGLQATRQEANNRIKKIILDLINSKELEQMPNEMIKRASV